MGKSGITDSQRLMLLAAVRRAAGELGEEQEAYRKRVMSEELGVDHLCDVSRGGGFDVLMARICRDAGDYDRAIGYSLSAAGRYRHVIVAAAEEIAPGGALEYVAGVMIQSRMVRDEAVPELAARLKADSGWLDFTMPQMRRLLAMLRTYLRRLK